MPGAGQDVPGIIANKSHHATTPEEKYRVRALSGALHRLRLRAAPRRRWRPASMSERPSSMRPMWWNWRAAGSPAPRSMTARPAPSCWNWRAATKDLRKLPTIHLVFSVLEEFNLRGAVTAAQVLQPDICIQLDLALATDTPDMGHRGDVRLGGGPVMSMFSFHGRGTLNGCIPHPALVQLFQAHGGRREDHAAAQRPYRRADRNLLCAARRQGRGLHRHGLPGALHAFGARSVRPRRSRRA